LNDNVSSTICNHVLSMLTAEPFLSHGKDVNSARDAGTGCRDSAPGKFQGVENTQPHRSIDILDTTLGTVSRHCSNVPEGALRTLSLPPRWCEYMYSWVTNRNQHWRWRFAGVIFILRFYEYYQIWLRFNILLPFFSKRQVYRILCAWSVTHYSKLTLQYQKNVSNTVASFAVNVTYCTTNDDNSLSDILARWGLMAEYSLHGSTGGWHWQDRHCKLMQLIQVPFVLTPECQTTVRGLLLGTKV